MKRYYSRLSLSSLTILLALLAVLSIVMHPSNVVEAQAVSFQNSELQGVSGLSNPTTLHFGPDGRLYVAQRNGTIHVFTIARNGPSDYAVTAQETIELIRQDIPNHADDTGAVDTSTSEAANNRQVTGIYAAGTAANPILYVSSSDPREGGTSSGDTNLDTNSGVVSRLQWNGASWDHVQLVRGLPRSEENHAVNGMALDEGSNTLYVTVGGFTNMGAASLAFANSVEYALAAAIVSVDLDAIGSTTYDIPTLDDPTRANDISGNDINDPFGGNNGLNQARIVPGGPVQIHASGFRNPFDVVLTENGRLYSIDNGPNFNWGGPPNNQTPGACDNSINENNSGTYQDNLHFITGAGYYAGHPAPVRGNPEGIYGVGNEADSPVPYALANPIECDYLLPGVQDGALATYPTSTNGLAEYTAGNFSGAMQGDLLTVDYFGNVYRMKLNAAGNALVDLTPSDNSDWGYSTEFSGFSILPLDITTQGDADIFPGTIWVGDFIGQAIEIFEPVDFICTGDDNDLLDEDADGYDNADELDNGTNPCSNGSQPADNDGDFESDLNDDDDDNDLILDIDDYFQIDAQNGVQTTLPVRYDFFQDDPGTGFFGVGFTGLMVNGVTDYLDMFVPADLTIGGTAGKATIDQFTSGTALGATNTQDYAFQWGVNVTSADGTFGIDGQLNSPFFPPGAEAGDEQGIYFGNGDQDNYFEVALASDDTTGLIGFEVIVENAGVPNRTFYPVPGADSSIQINLYITVDPVLGTAQPKYNLDGADYVDLGLPVALTGELLSVVQTNQVMAVGLMANFATTATTPFGGTWEYVFVDVEQPGILGVNPTSRDYGSILQGDTIDQTFVLQNLGQSTGPDINVSSLAITGSTNFVILSDPTPVVLAPGESTPVTVRYAPALTGTESSDAATLVINHDGTNNPLNVSLTGSSLVDYDPVYRVNVGGSALVDPQGILDWSSDGGGGANPPYAGANHGTNGSFIFVTGSAIDYSSPTLPSFTPTGLFNVSRYDTDNGVANAMEYAFPVADGTYAVRLYFAETYGPLAANGLRVFDAELEGTVSGAFNDIDRFALAGFEAGYMLSETVLVTDGTLNLRFLHQVENPDIQGIEIVPISLILTSDLGTSSANLDFGTVPAGVDNTQVLTLTNLGTASDPTITISDISYTGLDAADFSDDLAAPLDLLPGQSINVNVTINPSSGGAKAATLTINHNGDNAPTNLGLAANATSSGELALSPEPFNLGQIAVGSSVTLPLTLSNLGQVTDADIEITDLIVLGADTYQFQFEAYPDPLIVPAGQSITVDITFTPAQTGVYNINIAASHDGTNSTVTIAGVGEGVAPIGDPIYRVNVGGVQINDPDGLLPWEEDQTSAPSDYHVDGGLNNYTVGSAIDLTSPTLRSNIPMALFQQERWDTADAIELGYSFPVPAGTYEVHIYVAEIYFGIDAAGERVFDASLEGIVPASFANIDAFAAVGYQAGYMVSSRVEVTDGFLDLEFLHNTENPAVKAIEIYDLDADGILGTNPATHDFGGVLVSTTAVQAITLSNDGAGGAPPLTINAINFGTSEFTSDFVGPITLNEGESTVVNVSFTPPSPANYADTMTIDHTGTNTPTTVGFAGQGSQANLLSQDVTAIDFGNVLVNTNNDGVITVTNLGTGGDPDIEITALDFSGANASEFSHSETLPLIIAPGASEDIDIRLIAAADGAITAQLAIVNGGSQGDLLVDLTANASTPASNTYAALIGIDPGGDIRLASTSDMSFYIRNDSTAGQQITSVSFDISNAIVPDVVFDPTGLAGDSATLCLTPQAAGATSTGFVTPTDPCVDPFSVAYDMGYTTLTLNFNDFDEFESITLSVDIDPTSIRGATAPGPDDVGHISGYELIGTEVTITFNDGTIMTTELWRNGSNDTGSINSVSENVLATPTIEILGITTTPTTVSNQAQTVRVTGPVGATISLLVSEGDMVEPIAGGYDVDPFELNTILNIVEYTDTIGAGGTVDIPITLLDDELIDGTYGGKNVIVAVIRDGAISQTSALSNQIVLEYVNTPVPDITFAGNISTTAQEGQIAFNNTLGTSTSDASTPTISLSAIDDATTLAPTWLSLSPTVTAGSNLVASIDASSLAPGTHTATVTGTATGYNSATFTVTVVVNDLTVAITSPAAAANIQGTDVAVTWTSSGGIVGDQIIVTLDDLSTVPVEAPVTGQILNGNYTFTGVTPGNYAIIVDMADGSTNVYQGVGQTINITVSPAPLPDITFGSNSALTAQEGQTTSINDNILSGTSDASTPAISLSAIDDATTIAPTWLSVPANVIGGNNVTLTVDASSLAIGTHTATVTGTSAGYNNGTFTVSVTVNDLTIAITSPTNGMNIVGTDVAVTWTSTGGIAGDQIHVTLDDLSTVPVEAPVMGQALNGNYTFSGVVPGNYAVIVQMTDASNNAYTNIAQTNNITVSAVALPNIIFDSNINMTAQEGQGLSITDSVGTSTSDASTPTINLSAIDNGTGLAPTWLTVPASVVAGNTVSVDASALNLTPGTYTATVTGSSAGYNNATFTVTIVVNDIVTTITSPVDGVNIIGDSVTISWTSTGGLADDHIHLSLDDPLTAGVDHHFGSLPQNGSQLITGIAPADYVVTVEMANVNHIVYQGTDTTINITLSEPIIPTIVFATDPVYNAQAGQGLVISDVNAANTNDATMPVIDLAVIDNFTQIAPTWLTIGNAVVGGTDLAYTIDVTGLAPATYTATITGTSAAYVSDSFTITLVVSDVVVEITNPAPFASILGTDIEVTWMTTNGIAGDQIYLTLDNLATPGVEAPLTGLPLNGSFTFPNVPVGDYEIILEIADSSNRRYYGAVDTHQITKDPSTSIPTFVSGAVAPIGTINQSLPTFTWTPVSGATWYYIFINTPNAGTHTEWVNGRTNCTPAQCSYTPLTPLEDGDYEWAIMTSNANGNGPWSLVNNLTISGGTISTTTLVTPGDSASVNPTFRWQTTQGASWYRLYVAGPEGLIHDMWYHESQACVFNDCQATPALYITPGTYTYWVQHWGYGYVYGPWSPPTQFTMNAPVVASAAQAPLGTVATAQPSYSWQAVPGSQWHYLEIDDDFGNHLFQQWYSNDPADGHCDATGFCTVTPVLPLADGTYHWWVQSWGAGILYAPWSPTTTFIVDTASAVVPVAPLVVAPLSVPPSAPIDPPPEITPEVTPEVTPEATP